MIYDFIIVSSPSNYDEFIPSYRWRGDFSPKLVIYYRDERYNSDLSIFKKMFIKQFLNNCGLKYLPSTINYSPDIMYLTTKTINQSNN